MQVLVPTDSQKGNLMPVTSRTLLAQWLEVLTTPPDWPQTSQWKPAKVRFNAKARVRKSCPVPAGEVLLVLVRRVRIAKSNWDGLGEASTVVEERVNHAIRRIFIPEGSVAHPLVDGAYFIPNARDGGYDGPSMQLLIRSDGQAVIEHYTR